ncbi:hypothetical protein ACFFTM_14090 [Pseudoduganella plicata]|uniref:Transposase n=1 Tax=Pseudoduganella plicata TaxID=321984 RepID=A0A4P7BAA6_9BURK|nr:hypothetical protein [Pseudoduganella plicata]QBQ35506.1 hypothetical protein E1742_04495 [Pseudoduganella plicata]GGY97372.1 hypothetical protein GCM10007388_33820 [Pseudoduganella plicata]
MATLWFSFDFALSETRRPQAVTGIGKPRGVDKHSAITLARWRTLATDRGETRVSDQADACMPGCQVRAGRSWGSGLPATRVRCNGSGTWLFDENVKRY